jgi:hypothetical protein
MQFRLLYHNSHLGTSIGLTLRDETGSIAQSAAFTINPGSSSKCCNHILVLDIDREYHISAQCLHESSSQSSIGTPSTSQSASSTFPDSSSITSEGISSTSPDSSSITLSATSDGAAVGTTNNKKIGGIVGGVIGGLVLLAAMVLGLIFRRRNRRARGMIQSDSAPESISGGKPVHNAESHLQTSVTGLRSRVPISSSMTSTASPSHQLSGGMVESPLSWPDLGDLPSPSNTLVSLEFSR